MRTYRWPDGNYTISSPGETRACNCVGPQNGDPVCPCMMPGYVEREMDRTAAQWLRDLLLHGKPRVRVKAGSSRSEQEQT